MSNILVPVARNFEGVRVPCDFTATANGVQIALSGDPPVFFIPPGTTTLDVTAKPQKPAHWDHSVSLTLSASGVPAAAAASQVRTKLRTTSQAGTQVTILTISLSRFKDATSEVLNLLSNPPTARLGAPVDEIRDHQGLYGSFPPADWKLHPANHVHYIDPASPELPGALNFALAPPLNLAGESVVLRLAGVKAPKLFAVVWPQSIAPRIDAAPTPIFLFIRQGAGQNVGIGLFKGGQLAAYPDNFDYANTCLFQNLHYSAFSPLQLWGSKGVPYQLARSGTKAVTVIPCNGVGPEFGVIADMEQTGKILKELQAFMFWRAGVQKPPATVGNTAIGAFSSGNLFLNKWLKDPANRSSDFLSTIVKAVYFLDPPTNMINDCIASALAWAGAPERDKRIRLYSRKATDAHKKLLGQAPPREPFVRTTADKRRTASAVDTGAWTKTANNAGFPHSVDWQEAHHTIAATMLTHALGQGDI